MGTLALLWLGAGPASDTGIGCIGPESSSVSWKDNGRSSTISTVLPLASTASGPRWFRAWSGRGAVRHPATGSDAIGQLPMIIHGESFLGTSGAAGNLIWENTGLKMGRRGRGTVMGTCEHLVSGVISGVLGLPKLRGAIVLLAVSLLHGSTD